MLNVVKEAIVRLVFSAQGEGAAPPVLAFGEAHFGLKAGAAAFHDFVGIKRREDARLLVHVSGDMNVVRDSIQKRFQALKFRIGCEHSADLASGEHQHFGAVLFLRALELQGDLVIESLLCQGA